MTRSFFFSSFFPPCPCPSIALRHLHRRPALVHLSTIVASSDGCLRSPRASRPPFSNPPTCTGEHLQGGPHPREIRCTELPEGNEEPERVSSLEDVVGSRWSRHNAAPPVVLRFAHGSVADVWRRWCTTYHTFRHGAEEEVCRNEAGCQARTMHTRNPWPGWKPGVARRRKKNGTSCEDIRHRCIVMHCLHPPS